jgi:23S rRNA pseudouridine1911/1915/1917 synthase
VTGEVGTSARSARERIPAALAGERLDRIVSLVTGLSRRDAAGLVAAGVVSVNGQPRTSGASRLDEGDELAVDWEDDAGGARPEPDPDVAVAVVHEDPDVVVVDKPPGLVVHPGAGHAGGTLVHGLLARYPELAGVGEPERPGIVHRLDKETSGLLVVARSARAYESLVDQLARRLARRRYTALVWGAVEVDTGTVDAPVGRSAREPTRMAVSERGRPAVTHYRVDRRFADPVAVTLLDLRLETGRTHQIRVHLAAIGHPVVGDDRYRGARASLPVPRLFLHAAELSFTHPATGEALTFTSPLPGDLSRVLDGLG